MISKVVHPKQKTDNQTETQQPKVQAPVVVYADHQTVILKHLWRNRILDANELLKKLENFSADPLFQLVEDCGGIAEAKSAIHELQKLS